MEPSLSTTATARTIGQPSHQPAMQAKKSSRILEFPQGFVLFYRFVFFLFVRRYKSIIPFGHETIKRGELIFPRSLFSWSMGCWPLDFDYKTNSSNGIAKLPSFKTTSETVMAWTGFCRGMICSIDNVGSNETVPPSWRVFQFSISPKQEFLQKIKKGVAHIRSKKKQDSK